MERLRMERKLLGASQMQTLLNVFEMAIFVVYCWLLVYLF